MDGFVLWICSPYPAFQSVPVLDLSQNKPQSFKPIVVSLSLAVVSTDGRNEQKFVTHNLYIYKGRICCLI